MPASSTDPLSLQEFRASLDPFQTIGRRAMIFRAGTLKCHIISAVGQKRTHSIPDKSLK